MRSKLALCLIPLALPFVACDDSDGGGGGNGQVTADQAFEKVAATYCAMFTSCPISDESAIFKTLAANASTAQCQVFVNRVLSPERDLEAEVAAGRMTFDAAKLTACTNAAKQACDFGAFEQCRDVFKGSTAIDAACEYSEQCAGDAYCELGEDGCSGTCKARVAIGQPCDASESCSFAAGIAHCVFATGSTCEPYERITNAALGDTCGSIDTADKTQDIECAAGLKCDYDEESQSQKCVGTIAKGEACGPTSELDCIAGTLCLPDATGTAGTCSDVPLAGDGEACNTDFEAGPVAACNPLLQIGCDAETKTCKKWGDGSVGTFCANDVGFEGVCSDDNYCSDAGTCAAKKGTDAACQSSSECQSGNCINETCAAETCPN